MNDSQLLSSPHRRPSKPVAQSRALWSGLLVLPLVLLALRNRFIQDDAFISFRYADNLIRHRILSWNSSDVVKIEGYTNFSWTMLIALFMRLGLEPVRVSMALGIACGVGTLLVVRALAELVTNDFRYSLLAPLLLGTNYTFSCYMTGGLETQLQTFLLSLVAYSCLRSPEDADPPRRHDLNAGIFSALATLTRLDSLLAIATIVLATYVTRYRRSGRLRCVLAGAGWFSAPMLLLIVPWFYWKHGYYGYWLPNSFYLKGHEFKLEVWLSGLVFLLSFVSSYQLFVPFALLIILRQQLATNRLVSTLLLVCGAWCLYIVEIGGDFMEYRFMVPILPYLMICFVWGIQAQSVAIVRWLSIVSILLGSFSHQLLFKPFISVDTVTHLDAFVNDPENNWRGIGLKLHQLFPDPEEGITIAVTAAGAVPYYSRLRTIDMLGVNDRWIALNGLPRNGFRPGHSKFGTLRYYLDQRVNLVFGHPQVRPDGSTKNRTTFSAAEFQNFSLEELTRDAVPPGARVLKIPIDADHSVFAWYLTQSPAIDALIQASKARSFELD